MAHRGIHSYLAPFFYLANKSCLVLRALDSNRLEEYGRDGVDCDGGDSLTLLPTTYSDEEMLRRFFLLIIGFLSGPFYFLVFSAHGKVFQTRLTVEWLDLAFSLGREAPRRYYHLASRYWQMLLRPGFGISNSQPFPSSRVETAVFSAPSWTLTSVISRRAST